MSRQSRNTGRCERDPAFARHLLRVEVRLARLGETANRVRAAESQVSAARDTLRVMEESVLLSTATAYMDVSRDTANLEVQQNKVRVLQRTLKDTRNRFEAGQVTTTDVA
jgi:outer membrane protein